MKLSILFFSIVWNSYGAHAEDGSAELRNYTADEWQQKWDAHVTSDAASARTRLIVHANNTVSLKPVNDLDIGDVCERIVGCVGTAVSAGVSYSAVVLVATGNFRAGLANSMNNQLSASNYQLAGQIAKGTLTLIVVPLVLTVPQYHINVALQNSQAQTSTDNCGIAQNQAIAEQEGTAMYGFCLQLQRLSQPQLWSRADFGTVSEDSTSDDVGLVMETRLNYPRLLLISGCLAKREPD
jgi:hypothetical protein